jgi:hypothetical protein
MEEWGPNSTFPMVPGHEIGGIVSAVGSGVTGFKVGDTVGVGCLVDSCRKCDQCDKFKNEQFCQEGATFTYNRYAIVQLSRGDCPAITRRSRPAITWCLSGDCAAIAHRLCSDRAVNEWRVRSD